MQGFNPSTESVRRPYRQMCFVRGSGRRRRRQKRVRNVKESKRAKCGAQEPAPGPLWDCRRSRWASLMVGNNCTSLNSPLDSRQCLVLFFFLRWMKRKISQPSKPTSAPVRLNTKYHQIRVPLENRGEAIRPTRPEGTGLCP